METKDKVIKVLKEMKEVLTQIKTRSLKMKELNESSIKICSSEDFQMIVKENNDVAKLGKEVEDLINETEEIHFNNTQFKMEFELADQFIFNDYD